MNSGKYKIEAGRLVNIATGIPIPDDEPVVVFRAKDKHLPEVLKAYYYECRNEEQEKAIQKLREKILDWQEKNPAKVHEPD
jgi:hypothetical protein